MIRISYKLKILTSHVQSHVKDEKCIILTTFCCIQEKITLKKTSDKPSS